MKKIVILGFLALIFLVLVVSMFLASAQEGILNRIIGFFLGNSLDGVLASPNNYNCVSGRYIDFYGVKSGIDNDKDGLDLECGDCDDADKTSFPNSPYSECDGKDRNCDEAISCADKNSLVSASWSENSAVANSSVNMLAEDLIFGESVSFDVYEKNNGSCENSIDSAINTDDANLVSFYQFENNVQDAKNKNNGANYGAGFVQGKIGNAINLDGKNNYVIVNDSASLEFQNNFSVELWFKANSSDENKNQILLSKGLNYQIRYDEIAGKLSFYIPSSDDVENCMGGLNGRGAGPYSYPYQKGNFQEIWKKDISFGAGAGDINGDGYDDAVLISKNASGGKGKISVYLGNENGLDRDVFSVLDNIGSNGVLSSSNGKAEVVSGDFNRDGNDDIAVSTSNSANSLIYIYYGSKTGLINSWSKSMARPAACSIGYYTSTVPTGCYFPLAVGDTNKDGYDDLIIGENSINSNKGKVEIFRGGSSGLASTSSQSLSSSQANCNFGNSVSLGDANKDGNIDLLIGAPGCNGNGTAYLYYGAGNGISTSIGWTFPTPADTHNGYEIGYSNSAQYGWSVALGDIDGNGYGDLVVGQLRMDRIGSYQGIFSQDCEFPSNTGALWVFYSDSSGISDNPEGVSYASGNSGIHFFPFILKTEDINGDGYDEIIQASPYTGHYNAHDVDGGVSTANIFHYNPAIGRIPWPYSCVSVCQTYNTFDRYKADGFSVASGDFNGDSAGDIIMSNSLAYQQCPGCSAISMAINRDNANYTHAFADKPYYNIEIPLPNANEWHHLAVVYDGSMKMYVDGILRAEKNVNANVNPVISKLIIGAGEKKSNSKTEKNFNGLIDEVAIYNKTLSSEEIKTYYNSQDVKVNSALSSFALNRNSAIPNENLIVLYNFDSDFKDSSANGNDAGCSGINCPAFVSGKFSRGADFDGKDDNISAVWPSKELKRGTISFWIKLNSANGTIFSFYNKTTGNYGSISVKNKKLQARFNAGNYVNWQIEGSTTLNLNQWYYISFSHDLTQPKLYLNGMPETINYLSENSLYGIASRTYFFNYLRQDLFNIGVYGRNYFNGTIDDFAVYNRVLSSNEISDIYYSNENLMPNKTILEAKSFWIAEFKDKGNCNPPQYYFIAKAGNQEIKSNYLNVTDYQGACSDADGDGWNKEGGKCGLVDCNDEPLTGININSGKQEDCNNGIDDNCNKLADYEEASCSSLDSSPLYIFRNLPKEIEYNFPDINFSVSLNKQGNCLYSLDNFFTNYAMQNMSNYFFSQKYVLNGSYVAGFFCNDSFGNSAIKTSWFSVSSSAFCIDSDEDGYSVPTEGVTIDDCGGIYEIDCNDSNSSIYPYAEETCVDKASCNTDYNCMGGDYKKELVAYYSFDSDRNGNFAVRIDSSNYSNNGMGYYDSTDIINGKIGKAMRLGITSVGGANHYPGYILVPGSPSLNFNKEFSVSLWYSASAYSDAEGYAYDANLVDHLPVPASYGQEPSSGYKIGVSQGHPYILIGNSTSLVYSRKSFTIPINEWHHLAFVFNASERKAEIYLDGVLKETSNMDILVNRLDPGTTIGGGPSGNLQNSMIDEVKLWDYAVSGNIIQEEYQKGVDAEVIKSVANCQELQDIDKNLSFNYYLAGDIDCSGFDYGDGKGFMPLGYRVVDSGGYVNNYNGFSGNFDGRNYKIKNLVITRANPNGENSTGLFSGILGGVVKNLYLENLSIYSNNQKGRGDCGGITAVNDGILNNVHVSGNITCDSSAGGVAGRNYRLIEDSSSEANVSVNGNYIYSPSAGGFVNINEKEGLISQSYSFGNLYSTYSAGGFAGTNKGIIKNSFSKSRIIDNPVKGNYFGGFAYINSGIINNSYTQGSLICIGSSCSCNPVDSAAGFVKENYYFSMRADLGVIDNSYSAESINYINCANIKGFVRENSYGSSGNCTDSFWDNESAGTSTSACGNMRTTSQMKQQENYAGWDFVNVWIIDSSVNNGYPYLAWEIYGPDTTPPSFTNLANQTLSLGQNLNYDINADDSSGISCFKVNDTANFNINCAGLLTNKTALGLGIRYLNISMNDSLNNINSAVIFVNVTSLIIDTTPPYFIDATPKNMTLSFGSNVIQQINASDNIGLSCFKINWTTLFSINCSGYFNNISSLATGKYDINITINDTNNNKNYSVFWINITNQISSITLNLISGWNLISTPYTLSQNINEIFGAELQGVWEYSGNYRQLGNTETLIPGKAYWALMSSAKSAALTGADTPVNINLVSGWNLIGVNETKLLSSISGAQGAWDYNGNYNPATSLEKGKGYWVLKN